ncbi:MAG: AAA family ATPase [Elusimicrobia bacterium CG1_02_37_114]|nr:MAG: AAA family ATPase [Elusimicrobia bacterium CG1_02_37_114]PIV52884.1 MAG: AAA family ATPase [Elusimicrobia bacterium CG02_land_8_20_14_3_00_37_13]PIZ13658.1 MAG: AAA family ATPase [Elusimicrobia bacterium CG_4_10_14_0_8_um_filter_37_32]
MFNREIIKSFKEWAKLPERKPLVLRGARQVGKTTAVNIFSKEFDVYIYLNLEKKEDALLFERNLSVKELFQAILLYKNIQYKNGTVLLFIDEIQNSPAAVSVLRFFYEEMKDLYIIAAGSLFEIMLERKHISFPVGRVEYRFMYPLTFKEFMEALGETPTLDLLKTIPLPDYALPKLYKLFHTYSLVGGMPEVVNRYADSKEITTLSSIYQSLLTSFTDDISKYARNDNMVNIIKHCMEHSPYETGKRIKFSGFGNSNYRSREIGEALRIMERAMLLYLIYPTTTTKIPVIPNKKKSPRLQFLDIGLLNYVAGLQQYFFQYDDLLSFYKGILAEQVVGQELMASSMGLSVKPIFWVREKKQSHAEIDFLYRFKEYIIPVEVKSGKEGKMRSLHQFMNYAEHPYAIRLYSGEIKINKARTPDGKVFYLLNLPYFCISCLSDYIQWFLKKCGGPDLSNNYETKNISYFN